MAHTAAELIEILKKENPNTQVECIVVRNDGQLICVDTEYFAKRMKQLLEMFGD